ncbi:hypothetical protein L810_1719 [Burkholderia sp. AU4i]|nr:hypothetical protein L810_1719 [Burkholderia sp. AU4i]
MHLSASRRLMRKNARVRVFPPAGTTHARRSRTGPHTAYRVAAPTYLDGTKRALPQCFFA